MGRRRFVGRVYGDQSLHCARKQQPGIFAQQILAMMMAHHEIKIAGLQQGALYAAQHLCRIAFADLRHHHAHGVGLFAAKCAGQVVWLVLHGLGRGPDQVLRPCGDTIGCSGAAQDAGAVATDKPRCSATSFNPTAGRSAPRIRSRRSADPCLRFPAESSYPSGRPALTALIAK